MSDWENSAKAPGPKDEDRLPPHSIEAEQGVLGCILLEPGTGLTKVQDRVGTNRVFFDLRHATIFEVMGLLVSEGRALDVMLLGQRLRDRGQLEAVGGYEYLSGLADAVPSAAHLPDYLRVVWEKFLARKGFKDFSELASQMFYQGTVSEPMLAELWRRVEGLEAEALRHSGTSPKYLKRPGEFTEQACERFFRNVSEGDPGFPLPIEFRLKIRMGECTLVTGDDGSGKSTVLDFFAGHLMGHGLKVMVASFEMPASVTLWMLLAQLLGKKSFEDFDAHRKTVADGFLWLHSRLVLYDFLGIGSWREVLDAFRFAAQHFGVTVFILDSVMRIGIADDDYREQGFAAAAFAQFCKEPYPGGKPVHLFFVIHENKGSAGGKGKIRGSKLWSANVDNVVHVERNVEKGEELAELEDDLRTARGTMGGGAGGKSKEQGASGAPDKIAEAAAKVVKDLEEEYRKVLQKWDSNFVLRKQRYPGSQQNGSRRVWFDLGSFQFRERLTDPRGVNFLARWAASDEPEEREKGID